MGDGGLNVAGATGLRPAGPAERARTLYYIAAAVLAAMVPLILFAGLWVRAVLNQNDRDLRAYLVSHAEALSARLDQDVERQWSVLRAIALTPSLDGPDLAAFQATAERMVGVVPQWSALSVVDPASGRQLVSTLRPFGSDLPPLRNPEAARRVAETGRPAVLVRYPGESAIDERGGIFLAVPITRESGARLVLVAAVRAEAIQGVLEAVSEEGLLGVLVDERDRILARSQEPETFYGQPANAQLRNATAGRAAGLFAAETLDDTSVLTAYQRSSVTGWLAVLATDRARAHPSVDRSTWSVVAAGAIALTLAAALAVFLFYSVVERRVSDERYAASRALSALDARLLATTQEALAEQRKSASEREVLLREIYHRVKNNLQIIQSLLRLGSRDLEPGQREPFESAVRRIGAMARVHSLLYRSPDLASIDFKDYLEDLVDETADGFGADLRSIRTELEAQSMRVPLDTAVPLAFITVEILTNAFKHAFPHQRGGTVRVALRQEGENGVLTISDDGVGVPASDGGRKPLGLTLVRKLVEQVGGTLEPPEPGRSTYRVVFPLAPPPGSELPRLRPAGP
jgi:two-component sensor histidine kinase